MTTMMNDRRKSVFGLLRGILAPCMALAAVTLLATAAGAAPPWDPAEVNVYLEELAPNVYLVADKANPVKNAEGGSAYTSAGFIVGETGVLVIDTYVNARLTGQLIGYINSVTRKPIRYVVNTSYHGDHMYGNYLFPNAVIIQHEETAKYTREKWDLDMMFMTNQFGAGRGMEDSVPRPGDILLGDGVDHITVDLGGKIVEVHRFGFGQTIGDLQVWLPEEKILWGGNPIVAEMPVSPWLTEGGHLASLATLRRIADFLPENAIIVPGHGRQFKRSDPRNGLDFIIRYLEALDQKVREAVEQDMSYGATRKYAALEDFSAYSLFSWNHNQINLPCAHLYYAMKMGKTDKLRSGPTGHCTYTRSHPPAAGE